MWKYVYRLIYRWKSEYLEKSNSDHIVIHALALWQKFMNSNTNAFMPPNYFLSFESLGSLFAHLLSLDCLGAWKRLIYWFFYWKPVKKSIYFLHLYGVYTLGKPQSSFCRGWRNSGSLALPAELPVDGVAFSSLTVPQTPWAAKCHTGVKSLRSSPCQC